ncbi:MerR family transcriptional regulator [Streptomyces hoynatensis]|uniref:MerR family transcriptional regulator n=1 Tax=Streptomyces hoynatensis TaxID=1141874 RepID=A0A3A9ZEZ0_9ACTN|nr:MerR family transcriptional regulator [Streptomyces hoynatensis]RKN45807.1 MerR family transcriptional regulator [Streptomyces hoynatensis]
MTVTETLAAGEDLALTEEERSATESADDCASVVRPHPRPDGEDQYTISEVAAHTGLSVHTLRWYERIGLMQHVDRSHTGQRRYCNRDLEWLNLVGQLRLTGMAVADMVRYAALVRAGEHTYAERSALLRATRESVLRRIAELQGTLAVLDFKIGIYADAPAASERL